mmetsp:Transcript_82833/g.130513  ORF Transcript_82833/g.130513 Transcript_82833/m.130513 type:complete len:233 (+) Transcript_82833:760-1458(+)
MKPVFPADRTSSSSSSGITLPKCLLSSSSACSGLHPIKDEMPVQSKRAASRTSDPRKRSKAASSTSQRQDVKANAIRTVFESMAGKSSAAPKILLVRLNSTRLRQAEMTAHIKKPASWRCQDSHKYLQRQSSIWLLNCADCICSPMASNMASPLWRLESSAVRLQAPRHSASASRLAVLSRKRIKAPSILSRLVHRGLSRPPKHEDSCSPSTMFINADSEEVAIKHLPNECS